MKSNLHDDDLRLVHVKELRSRIDKGLAALDRGEGTNGGTFIRRMLGGLDSRKVKHKLAETAEYSTG